jgi:hypothetical protein
MVEQNRRISGRLRGGRAVALTALALGMMPLLAGSAQAATAVDLGTAETFALLAGSAITNVPTSTITGDIGLCCTGTAVDGGINQIDGALYVDSAGEAWQAQRDLDIAYASASQPATVLSSTDLSLAGTSANPLTPGVYSSAGLGSLEILGGLYLDFQGDPNAVFIFRGTDLITAANAAGSVTIVNAGSGASSACNISWQLTDATQGVTLGANSAFKGTTMSLGASTLETGATVDGRILTRDDKAVELDQNTITRTACAAPASAAGGATTTTPGTTPPAGTPTPTPVATTPRPTPTQTPLAGTALLRGPRGPVRGPFTVTVTGRSIQSVTFYVDGKRRTTVNAARGRRAFSMRIDPRRQGRGVHRVTARVTFTPGSRTGITTRRVTYRRPPGAATPPRFTG